MCCVPSHDTLHQAPSHELCRRLQSLSTLPTRCPVSVLQNRRPSKRRTLQPGAPHCKPWSPRRRRSGVPAQPRRMMQRSASPHTGHAAAFADALTMRLSCACRFFQTWHVLQGGAGAEAAGEAGHGMPDRQWRRAGMGSRPQRPSCCMSATATATASSGTWAPATGGTDGSTPSSPASWRCAPHGAAHACAHRGGGTCTHPPGPPSLCLALPGSVPTFPAAKVCPSISCSQAGMCLLVLLKVFQVGRSACHICASSLRERARAPRGRHARTPAGAVRRVVGSRAPQLGLH